MYSLNQKNLLTRSTDLPPTASVFFYGGFADTRYLPNLIQVLLTVLFKLIIYLVLSKIELNVIAIYSGSDGLRKQYETPIPRRR